MKRPMKPLHSSLGCVVLVAACLSATVAPAPSRASARDVLQFLPDDSGIVVPWRGPNTAGPGLAVLDLTTGRPDWVEQVNEVTGAAVSPNGRWLVYQVVDGATRSTVLLDLRTKRVRRMPVPIGPPYAWREDSGRIAGTLLDQDGHLNVVFFNTREFGETLRVRLPVDSVEPGNMLWLPDTDDVAFLGILQGKRDVYAVEAGQVRQFSTTGDVLAVSRGSGKTKLVWARSSKNIRYILLSLYEFDTEQRNVRRLRFPERVTLINPTPRQAPLRITSVCFAPDMSRLAVVAEYAGKSQGELIARVYTMAFDGTGVRMVRVANRVRKSAYPVLTACFSRDGKQLVVLHENAIASALAVYRSDGANGRVVARSGAAP